MNIDPLLASRFKIRSFLVLSELHRCLWFGLEGKMAHEQRYKSMWAKEVKAGGQACSFCEGFHGLLVAAARKSYEWYWEARIPELKEAAPSMGTILPGFSLTPQVLHSLLPSNTTHVCGPKIDPYLKLHKSVLICRWEQQLP